MILPNPENFANIEISGKSNYDGGFEAPYRVVGLTPVMKEYSDIPGAFYRDFEPVVIQDGFANHQVAQAWMNHYLDSYVKAAYFQTVMMFTPLDSNNKKD